MSVVCASVSESQIALFYLSVFNCMHRASTCSPKGQNAPDGTVKFRLFGTMTHPSIMSCPTAKKKGVVTRVDKFLR